MIRETCSSSQQGQTKKREKFDVCAVYNQALKQHSQDYEELLKKIKKKEIIERNIYGFNLKRFAEELIQRAKNYISGEFGEPSEYVIRKFFISIQQGDAAKTSDFISRYITSKKFATIASPLTNETPLAFACSFDSKSHNKICLDLISDLQPETILILDNKNRNVIHHCCLSGACTVLEHLLRKLGKFRTNAETREEVKLFDKMIDAKDSLGLTPLMIACESGFDDIVESLIEHGANLQRRESHRKWTALHFAAKEGYLEVVKSLLKEGGQNLMKKRGRFDETPEDVAAENEFVEVALHLRNIRHRIGTKYL